MSIRLKVLTTITFKDDDSLENYLKIGGILEPHEIIDLVEGNSVRKSIGEIEDIPGAESTTETTITTEEI